MLRNWRIEIYIHIYASSSFFFLSHDCYSQKAGTFHRSVTLLPTSACGCIAPAGIPARINISECAPVQFRSIDHWSRYIRIHTSSDHRARRSWFRVKPNVSCGFGAVLVLWSRPAELLLFHLNRSSTGARFPTAPCCSDIMVSEYTHLSAAYDIFAQRPNANSTSSSSAIAGNRGYSTRARISRNSNTSIGLKNCYRNT